MRQAPRSSCADHIAFSSRSLWERASSTTVFLLRRADLGQQRHGIERPVLRAQPLLHGLGDYRMRQSSLIGRGRIMIALDHLGAFTPLLLQLERRLKEVHIKGRGGMEPACAAPPLAGDRGSLLR